MPSQIYQLMMMSSRVLDASSADVGMHRVSCLQRCEKDLSSVAFDPELSNAYPSNCH